jgi:large subunit ribosomal protein L15e
MGYLKYLAKAWKKPALHDRMVQWRTEPATLRVESPTRIDRARGLGYKAKQGVFVVRQRVTRGSHRRPRPKGGRRPKRFHTNKNLNLSYQTIAQQRAQKVYPNCEVLNSYWVGRDGKHFWYEIIMVDPINPSVMQDKNLNWISQKQHTGRSYRGLTSSAKKSRGLRHKGKGSEKTRQSFSKYFN